mgnify:CR=1 FL=1
MEQFGSTLMSYARKMGRIYEQSGLVKIPKKQVVLKICLNLLDQLETIHEAGYVHNDIKPSNVTIGQADDDSNQAMKARLIDYGVSKSYLNEDGFHRSESESCAFSGNSLFAHHFTLSYKFPSRACDVVSLGFMMLYILGEFNLKHLYF